MSVEPAITALIGLIVLGQLLDGLQVAGLALVVLATVITERVNRTPLIPLVPGGLADDTKEERLNHSTCIDTYAAADRDGCLRRRLGGGVRRVGGSHFGVAGIGVRPRAGPNWTAPGASREKVALDDPLVKITVSLEALKVSRSVKKVVIWWSCLPASPKQPIVVLAAPSAVAVDPDGSRGMPMPLQGPLSSAVIWPLMCRNSSR
jgi:hypothetical protein